jgi:hypothetical protein
MSFHGSGDEPTNRYLTPYDSKNLTIRISQGPRLAFIVTKDFSAGDYDINRATYFCNVSQNPFSSLKSPGIADEKASYIFRHLFP